MTDLPPLAPPPTTESCSPQVATSDLQVLVVNERYSFKLDSGVAALSHLDSVTFCCE